jgi:hypothetical protein
MTQVPNIPPVATRHDTLAGQFPTGIVISPKNRERSPRPELVRQAGPEEFFVPSETAEGLFHRVEAIQGFAATCSGCSGNLHRGFCHHRIDVQAFLTRQAIREAQPTEIDALFGAPMSPVVVE